MPLSRLTDANGNTLAHDDPYIGGTSMLVRNINPVEHVIFDENIQADRIKSAAFSRTKGDPDYGMSVDLGQLLSDDGLPEDHMVPTGMGAVKLRVSDVRTLQLKVGSDPEPYDKYHGQVWGVADSKRTRLHGLVIDWVCPIENVRIR